MSEERIIKIQAAQVTKSGKNIAITGDTGRYYCHDFSLLEQVGRSITADISYQTLPDGAKLTWINDWSFTDPELFEPHSVAQDAPKAVTAQSHVGFIVNKDASIVAQALVKAISPGTMEKAWECYTWLYLRAEQWDGKLPYLADELSEKMALPAEPFEDKEIPL